MSPFVFSGTLTSESREVAVSETWDTWSNPQARTDVAIVDGSIQLAEAPPDSAIHRWKMTAGSGSVLTDSIGSNDGTINGATWVSDTWSGGWALSGDGTDDDVAMDSAVSIIDAQTAFSVAFTFETDTPSQANGTLFANTAPDGGRWVIAIDSGDLIYRTYDGSTDVDEGGLVGLSAGTKYRVFYAFDGSTTGTLWINGTESTDTPGTPPSLADAGLHLFARTDSSNFGDAVLDNVIVMDVEEDSTTVSDDYDAQPWS